MSRRQAQYGSLMQGMNARLSPSNNEEFSDSALGSIGMLGKHPFYGRDAPAGGHATAIEYIVENTPAVRASKLRSSGGHPVFFDSPAPWDDSLADSAIGLATRTQSTTILRPEMGGKGGTPTPLTGAPHRPRPAIPSSASNDPAVWGPAKWYSIHNGSLYYPVAPTREERDEFKSYAAGLPASIPCAVCKTHAREFLFANAGRLEAASASRDSVFRFFVDLHNHANKKTGKRIWSYDEAFFMYVPKR